MDKSKNASVVIYIMIVLFIAMTIAYIVLNKTSILTNDLSVGSNSQELYSEILKKGKITLKAVNDYNSNSGDKFSDSISCPSDVLVKYGTGFWQVSTHLVESDGSFYCKGIYSGEEFKIIFSENGDDRKFFKSVYKNGETKDLLMSSGNDLTYDGNQISSATITSSNSLNTSNISDGNENTIFSIENSSLNYNSKYIDIGFNSNKKIDKIILKKPLNKEYTYRYEITYSDDTKSYSSPRKFSNSKLEDILYFQSNNFIKDVKNVRLELLLLSDNLYISDLEIYTYSFNGEKLIWTTSEDFTTGNIKSISFNQNGISIGDGIDDDLDNDDYRVSSNNGIYYPNSYQDDDTVPRLTFFGSIKAVNSYYSVFWNNYKTNELINNNLNNNDLLNKKSVDTENAYFYLDLNGMDSYNYDLKIIEFDKDIYKKSNILSIQNSYDGSNININKGFINYSNGSLFLSEGTGSTMFSFDLKNKDYSIFLKNNSEGKSLNYKLTAKTFSGESIYINPINDSGTGVVEALVNHIIIGPDKNYIGDNFKVIGDKVGNVYSTNFKPKTCLEILNNDPLKKNHNGYYKVYLDSDNPTMVYCDMTTGNGGWTRYVNIKGNYDFEDAKNCWLGKIISNDNLECFNPNRFGIEVKQLINNDWSGQYIYNIPISNIGASLDTNSVLGQRNCLGHKDFMTLMKTSSSPSPDGSDSTFLWLGRNYCNFNREVGGLYNINNSVVYMNYDYNNTGFGVLPKGASWESSSKTVKLYFREDIKETNKIVSYNSGKRWDNGTYAVSCNAYKNPKGGYEYAGDIGDGFYYLDPDGDGLEKTYLAYCNMTVAGGGWTKLEEWNDSGTNNYIAGKFSGGKEILMTYKRKDSTTNNYALKIKQFKTKQCGNEHTTISEYVDHILTGSWGDCPREATAGDYNDIITEKVIEGIYINDTCVNGTLHKNIPRNTSWSNESGRGDLQYWVTDTTVLMGPRGVGSARCASTIQETKAQSEVTTWVR